MIGILTFWGIPNCGTFAQAYALQKRISEMMPNEKVYQLAYLNKKHKNFYNMDCLSEESLKKRNELFAQSYDMIPNITIRNDEDFLDLRLESLVLGSDIIWDYNVPAFGEDPYLYGLGINAKNKISYATSFGTCKSNWNRIPSYVIDGLRSLDKISVRDVNAQLIVQKILNQKADIVLDPIWLWDWNSDTNVVLPRDTDYIFVYGENFSLEYKKLIKQYAEKYKLIIVGYGTIKGDFSWCDKLVRDYMVTPFELIGYIKNANILVTNSFHGFNFGLYFHKKIIYYRSDFIDSKLQNMLSELKINDIYMSSNNFERMLNEQLNFESIEQKIFRQRELSIEFLQKGLCKTNGI